MNKKSSSGVQLAILGGVLGAAALLAWLPGESECSNDPGAPSDQRCGEGSGGHGSSFHSGSGTGSGGDATARSERGGFGQFARRFSLFS